MTLFGPLSPAEFLGGVAVAGCLMVVLVFIPVQIVSKYRRIKKNYRRLTCRICGYRFLRQSHGVVECPHCGAKN